MIHGKHPSLTKPLEKGKKTDVRRGTLHHDHIIGRRVWDLVQAHKGAFSCLYARSHNYLTNNLQAPNIASASQLSTNTSP